MRHRLAVLVATGLVGTLLIGSLAQTVTAQTSAPGLTLPAVSGSLVRGGQFNGALTITRLTNRAGQLVADGMIVGNVAIESQSSTSLTPVYASTSTPAPTPSGGTIFAATSTPAPGTEIVVATATHIMAATFTATPTATITATAEYQATVATVSAATDQIPRAALSDDLLGQVPVATPVSQSFREIPLTLVDPDLGACDVLQFDVGAIFVDQLGVQLDLAPATLDLASLPRASRPLGGLHCTVASLLDLGPGSTQAALLNELLPTVNRALSNSTR